MKHFASKFMVTLACCIIMLHAVVPHHHHDCCGGECFVFESEVACHCADQQPACEDHHCHHHGHSHHPLNHCMLQDLLSQLVISQSGEETYWALSVVPECDMLGVISAGDLARFDIYDTQCELLDPQEQEALPDVVCTASVGLRAPPAMSVCEA